MTLLKIALKSKEKQFIFLPRKIINILIKTAKNSLSEMFINKESNLEMEEVINKNNP
jgi:hypothetical protein